MSFHERVGGDTVDLTHNTANCLQSLTDAIVSRRVIMHMSVL
jgi:hypothetical protein